MMNREGAGRKAHHKGTAGFFRGSASSNEQCSEESGAPLGPAAELPRAPNRTKQQLAAYQVSEIPGRPSPAWAVGPMVRQCFQRVGVGLPAMSRDGGGLLKMEVLIRMNRFTE